MSASACGESTERQFGQDKECEREWREHLEQQWKDKEQPEQEKLRQRRTHFNNYTKDKVAILEKRVVLLERHIMRVEQELCQRAFPANCGSSNGGSDYGSWQKQELRTCSSNCSTRQGRLHHLELPVCQWRENIHFCQICLVVFESGSQLHKHLRQSKHFSPAASPASFRQSSPAPTPSVLISPAMCQQSTPPPKPPVLTSLALSRQSSPAPTPPAMALPATSQQSSSLPSSSSTRPASHSPCQPTPPPSSPCRSQSTTSPAPSALPWPVPRLAVTPPPPRPAFTSPAAQLAASPILRMFGAISPQSVGAGADEKYEADNESTATMDRETQLEAVYCQIHKLRWTSLSGDRLPVLRMPDDVFEPWDVNLISSFDQQTHSKLISCS